MNISHICKAYNHLNQVCDHLEDHLEGIFGSEIYVFKLDKQTRVKKPFI